MTIKLVLLKSGEDIIADIGEMANEDKSVIGYFLHRPCVTKLRNIEEEGKTSFKVSMFPWMPLTSDETIPIPADWVVTITEPKPEVKDMYTEEVLKYGQNSESDLSDESTDSDKSD